MYKKVLSTIHSSFDSPVLSELHVLVAEAAYLTDNFHECKDILKRFFKYNKRLDKCYCIAKLLNGLLICRGSIKGKYGLEYLNTSRYVLSDMMNAMDTALTLHR